MSVILDSDRFLKYQTTPPDYIPNNLYCDNSLQLKKPHLPLVAYNAEEEPIGFTWNYGESIYLEFETTGQVLYDPEDANLEIGIYESADTYLNSITPKNYPHSDDNGIKLRSEEVSPNTTELGLDAQDEDEDEESEAQETTEDAETYFKDGSKIFQVLIYNFRHDVVAWSELKAGTKVRVLADSFYPCSLVKGTYKLQLNLIDKRAGVQTTLINPDECSIYIK